MKFRFGEPVASLHSKFFIISSYNFFQAGGSVPTFFGSQVQATFFPWQIKRESGVFCDS